MSDKKIKHFVVVRFFPFKRPDFQRDIFDTDFLSTQVSLAKNNLLKSLENQTDKNFEIYFLANGKYFDNPKYEFIFTELSDSPLTIKFIRKKSDPSIQDAYNNYDFVIQTRVDFDDFMYKDAVADTQNKINECDSILSYGYSKGYMYFNEDLYDFPAPKYAKRGQRSPFQSWIIKSSFAKKIPYVSAYPCEHTKIVPFLKEFLEKNGFEFSENMYQNNITTNAFIYFRHDATWMNNGKPYTERPKGITHSKILTTDDITKKQLEEEFGFFYDLNSIK